MTGYVLDRSDEGVVEMEHAHLGDGVIRVKLFFGGHTRSATKFAIVTIPPGASEGRHDHLDDELEELYYVMAGEGIFWVGPNELRVRAGDAILVAKEMSRGIENPGPSELQFALLFGPASAVRESTNTLPGRVQAVAPVASPVNAS